MSLTVVHAGSIDERAKSEPQVHRVRFLSSVLWPQLAFNPRIWGLQQLKQNRCSWGKGGSMQMVAAYARKPYVPMQQRMAQGHRGRM